MATTIKSTGLDFTAIKNNLKSFLQEKQEFADYNFEASGISNILDVLAYNTHYNGLLANFALNESFLATAQLRSSVVSLAEAIGYIPDSKTAANATLNLSVTDPAGPSRISIPSGFKFSTTVNEASFTFTTIEPLLADKGVGGLYEFYVEGTGDTNIPVYEGELRTKTFIVGAYSEDDVYIIPNKNLDLDTVEVRVYDSPTETAYTNYNNINTITNLNAGSTIYVMKEAPNGYYELTFGNGLTLGKVPTAGNKVEVDFIATNGAEANGATKFTPNSKISVKIDEVTTNTYDVTTVVVAKSSGGSDKEEADSIRKNAPFQYAAQNRMVTAADYASLILRNFSNVIADIKAWGGEDNVPADYGRVYVSIKFVDGLSDANEAAYKTQITQLAQELSIVSFTVVFEDPIETYVEVGCQFQFNPQRTSLTVAGVESLVRQTIQNYTDDALGNFDQSFRRSNLLTRIDESNDGILSSRASIKMQQRFVGEILVDGVPVAVNTQPWNYTLAFPARIKDPQLDELVLTSTNFVYKNKLCRLQNRLGSNVIQIVNVGTSDVVVDNIGEFNPTKQTVNLIGFQYTSIANNQSFIKVSVLPSNEGSISPERNNILVYDPDASFATAILTNTE